MKKFIQFVSEEVDLRNSKGIPSDFMSKTEDEVRRNLGIRPDDERQMITIWPEFERNMRESNQLLSTGPDGRALSQNQLRERIENWKNLLKR